MKAFYQSPVGVIEVREANGYITSLSFSQETITELDTEEGVTPLLEEAIKQLEEYFSGSRKNFNLPLKQEGTSFQQKAWSYLSTIPYGETVSYKEQAITVGSPKAYRAVGSANGKNKIAIIVPCHRVVSEENGLGGYAYGLEVKKYLLELESRNKKH